MVITIALLDVIDDFFPAYIAEVDINIRHGDTFRIQKTLKEQIILQGVKIGNAKQIGHDTAGSRTTPWPYGNPLLPGMIDKIPDNQEITVIAHTMNNGQLIIQTFLYLRRNFRITVRQCLFTQSAQISLIIFIGLRYRIVRQLNMTKLKINLTAFGYLYGIADSLRRIRKKCRHFRRGL